MLTVEEALARILDRARLTAIERIPLDRCLGRVLAEGEIAAQGDVPPFANSAMDGYALRASDVPGRLPLVGEVAAGASTLPSVGAHEAVRIMTGAPLPPGADAVVPLEQASELDGWVTVTAAIPRGGHVRAVGHDTRAGERVRFPAAPLGPAGIALLASLGVASATVRRRPRVAILSTGEELAAPGTALGPGQIHDANGPALAAAVVEAGGVARLLERVGDDPRQLSLRLAAGIAASDLLVVSGGVSVGAHDHVRAALERDGTLDFWRVRVQPGKPLAVGSLSGRVVIGLPGNPVSALVTFELFVRPLVRAMLGLAGDGRARVRARLADAIPKDRARRAYLRVRLEPDGRGGFVARSAGGQQSSQLRPLAEANALLVVPQGIAEARAGARYDALVTGVVP